MWTLDVQEIIIWLMLAFAGGAFGAAVGGLSTFVFCGLGAVISSIFMITGNSEAAGFVDAWVTWGPLVGPQTAFVGGCWAAVYARYNAGFHNGRDICQPLAALNQPKVLIAGGFGGVVGALMTWMFWMLPDYTVGGSTVLGSANDVACGVAAASMVGRLVYGKTGLFGEVKQGVKRFVGGEGAMWLPYMHDSVMIMVLASAVGLSAAVLTFINPNTHLIIFGVMCLYFLFMILGQSVIAGHHFAITAYFATVATGNVAWGLAFAIATGFFCEISAYLFTAHGDSHIDPPTCGIMVSGFIQPFLIWIGVMKLKPVSAASSVADLEFSQMFIPQQDFSGVLALITVVIFFPLLMKYLRSLPAKA